MSFFSWFSKCPSLNHQQQHQLERLKQLKRRTMQPLQQQRLVIVDVETSGLNMLKDKILSIAAIVIEQGAIQLKHTFNCTLNRESIGVTPSILLHRISPSQLAEGVHPVDALLAFWQFVGDSPLFAFHAEFDKRMLQRESKELLNFKPETKFYDVAEIAPLLESIENSKTMHLDDWVDYFKLTNLQRHTAQADALVTAELLLILLRRAKNQAVTEFSQLDGCIYNKRKRMKQSFAF